jgi:hypothetical protein
VGFEPTISVLERAKTVDCEKSVARRKGGSGINVITVLLRLFVEKLLITSCDDETTADSGPVGSCFYYRRMKTFLYTSDGQLAARGLIYSGPAKSQVYFQKS